MLFDSQNMPDDAVDLTDPLCDPRHDICQHPTSVHTPCTPPFLLECKQGSVVFEDHTSNNHEGNK